MGGGVVKAANAAQGIVGAFPGLATSPAGLAIAGVATVASKIFGGPSGEPIFLDPFADRSPSPSSGARHLPRSHSTRDRRSRHLVHRADSSSSSALKPRASRQETPWRGGLGRVARAATR